MQTNSSVIGNSAIFRKQLRLKEAFITNLYKNYLPGSRLGRARFLHIS